MPKTATMESLTLAPRLHRLPRLGLLAALAASASAALNAPPPGGWPAWTAHRVWPNQTSVAAPFCLDGSPPLYYVSPGFGDGAAKWQLHHEGGAWCGDAESCSTWWGYRSTLVDPDSMPFDAMANTGYFNRTSSTNSMWDWNFVFIRYCDGWSFASDRSEPSFFTNASGANITIHFRGMAVLEAVRGDLLVQRGMAAATDLVVGGCSAGGLAVYLHCDEWQRAMAAANAATRTVCLADSGWFPIVPAAGFPSTWFNGVWLQGFINLNISRALSADCLVAHAVTNDQWKCGMAEVAALYIKTPLFAFQSAYDSFQIFNMERCIPMPPDPTSPCSSLDVTLWGGNLTQNMRAWLGAPNAVAAGSAAFVDSCYHHCGTWADFDEIVSWRSNAGPMNTTASAAFGAWRKAPASNLYTQPTAYPCLGATCCGAHGPDSAEEARRI
jgi:hypothetical protein